MASAVEAGWISHEADDIAEWSYYSWARRAPDASGEWTRIPQSGDSALLEQASKWPKLNTTDDQRAAPDHRWLTGTTADGTPLWQEAASRASRAHDDPAPKIAFSADGHWLASAGKDATVRLWPLSPTDLAADACARALRNLSAEEWKAAFGDEAYRATCLEQPTPSSESPAASAESASSPPRPR